MTNEEILKQFDATSASLRGALDLVRLKLTSLLEAEGIKIQYVESRLKTKESLQHKLARPDRSYTNLWDVTDLIGLRVITYFEETIERAAAIIERHFSVDFTHSRNRLQHRDFGRFGYRSLHYTCALSPEMTCEAALPSSFRFEIQVRTVLQHAWAEIEHDLGYKVHDTIPESIRRRFSRVASLLEIADQEFESIRNDLFQYEKSLRDACTGTVSDAPLDRISLGTVALSPEVSSLDRAVSEAVGKKLSDQLFYPEYLLKMLRLSGISTTRDLMLSVCSNHDAVLRLVPPYFEFARSMWNFSANTLPAVYRGYSLFFLAHLTILRSPSLELNKVARLTEFYRELDYPSDERMAAKVASELHRALSQNGVGDIVKGPR